MFNEGVNLLNRDNMSVSHNCNEDSKKECIYQTSLMVQWLRIHLPMQVGIGLIPHWGIKIPHAASCSQKKLNNIKQYNACKVFSTVFGTQ